MLRRNRTMKFYAALLSITFSIIFIGGSIPSSTVVAGKAGDSNDYSEAETKNGALLYDNWPKITKAELEGNHPLYPADAKKSGKSTYRCKECHGWDYIGNKGRYSKGSHYTGIEGVYDERSESPADLYEDLTDADDSHDFSRYLSEKEIWDLVKFLREGLAPIEKVIDDQGKAKGDSANGIVLYTANCSSCHGDDGDAIDFNGKKEGIQGVGWLANKNPQESIHKIRWGHPGSDMPSMIVDAGLTEQEAIDILAYSQMLGAK
jgi:thiosulfate dehydrogenase